VRRTSAFLIVGSTLLATGCVSGSDIDAIHSKLGEIERELVDLQRVSSTKQNVETLQTAIDEHMATLLKAEADMRLTLEQLSSQIDQLEANLEDTNYRLSQLSQQIAATNQDLKTFRSSGIRGDVGESAQEAPPLPTDPQALYQTAYNDYLRGNYDLSILGFRQYLESFPDTELADNASYWIGECYFSQGKYDQAIREFDNILRSYERSDKTASALLKKAYAYIELGQISRGVDQLRSVIETYPGTDEANLARQRLQELG
jgi:tol-pal system protein YbgF